MQSKNNQPKNLETANKTIKFVSYLWSFISGSKCIMLGNKTLSLSLEHRRSEAIFYPGELARVNGEFQKNILSHQTP